MPPLPTVRALARERTPAESNDDVAVAPKRAVLAVSTFEKNVVDVPFVIVSPPLKLRRVVVAFAGKRYAKLAPLPVIPSEEVAVSVYPPLALPTSTSPYAGAEVIPVPP